MLAKKTCKNQITLPKEVIKDFPDTEFFDVRSEGGRIVLTPVRISPITDTLEEIRDKIEKLGITRREVTRAVKWARRKR